MKVYIVCYSRFGETYIKGVYASRLLADQVAFNMEGDDDNYRDAVWVGEHEVIENIDIVLKAETT